MTSITVKAPWPRSLRLLYAPIQALIIVAQAGSAPAPSVPVNTVLPAISGVVRDGETLTCDTGTWTESPDSYTYQWTRDGLDITGETSATYDVVPGDIPTQLACKVIATKGLLDSAPATSAAVSSPLRAIYQIDASARVWVHTQGTGVAVGNPIPTWTTADGLWTLVQPVTSKQPTRLAGGAFFDGIEDYSSANDSAVLLNAAYTVLDGFDDVEDSTTAIRQLWGSYTQGVSTGTRRCSHVNYSRPGSPSTTRQRYLLGGNSSAAVIGLNGYSGIGVDGYDLAFRSSTPGAGSASATEMSDPLGTPVTSAWPAVATTNDLHTVGAERINTAFSPSSYWQGTLRYHVILGLNLNDTQLATVRDALAAEGVL